MAKTKREARKEAEGIVTRYAAAAGAVGWIPGSTLVVGPAQYKMIRDIAQCYEVHSYDAQAILAVVTSTFAGQVATDVLLSFIPVLGWAAKSGTASATTFVAGAVIADHFEDLSNLPS